MLTQSEKILEMDKVKEIVALYAVSEIGKELIRKLPPLITLLELSTEFARLKEFIQLFENGGDIPIHNLRDIRPLFPRISMEKSMLEPGELLEVATFLVVCRSIVTFFNTHSRELPYLAEIVSKIKAVRPLEESIASAIDEKERVRDNASSTLKKVRAEIHVLEERIHGILHKKMKALELEPHTILQEDYFTMRNERYVLPVRAGSKRRITGIVHGSSKTGETLFIEPFELVEHTNELANVRHKEKREVCKILKTLTDKIRTLLDLLRSNLYALGQVDCLYARARCAFMHSLAIPEVSPSAPFNLLHVHHPLLYLQKKDDSIPTEVSLSAQDRVLVISGPNAGGKTTVLKTIALSAMMTQCAIPIPASPDSSLPLFTDFLADIGDEQNVTEGLSTFTAHIRRIAEIRNKATADSLIVLDELGTATDPSEGGALAVALLEEFSRHARLVVVTSHLSLLKQWAHSETYARNASFRLHEESLQPTFKLSMDVPGASEALIIASRMGLEGDIITRAETLASTDQRELTSLIISLQMKENKLDNKIAEVSRLKERLAQERDACAGLERQLNEQQRTFRQSVVTEKARLIEDARTRIEEMIAHLPSRKEIARAREELKTMQKKTERELEALRPKPKDTISPDEIQKGMYAFIEKMNDTGRIISVDEKKHIAQVELNALTVEVDFDDLRRAPEGISIELPRHTTKIPRSVTPPELDLHGMRVEEAVEKLDKYLDDAVLNDYERVKLIHGYGTGRLRDGVHKYLRTHPHVKEFRLARIEEGGHAVTIVFLK